MTDNEIIKALECCSKNEPCNICSYDKKEKDDFVCCSKLMVDTIDLINRQKAEIERLKTECGLAKFDKYKAEFEEFRAEIKANAIKEFAERLKETATRDAGVWWVMEEDIDNLAKEMVGGAK